MEVETTESSSDDEEQDSVGVPDDEPFEDYARRNGLEIHNDISGRNSPDLVAISSDDGNGEMEHDGILGDDEQNQASLYIFLFLFLTCDIWEGVMSKQVEIKSSYHFETLIG